MHKIREFFKNTIFYKPLKYFYNLGRILINFRNWLKYRNNIFLVYTMGRVGSQTTQNTLQQKLAPIPVFLVHFLSDNWLLDILPKNGSVDAPSIKKGTAIRDYISKKSSKRKKIITLVREPVTWQISFMFHNWQLFFKGKSVEDITEEDIYNHLNNSSYEYMMTWFNSEFKLFTGIDIYQYPFDKEKGYIIFSTKEYDVLCMKMEKVNDCFREAYEAFTGLKIERLIKGNITREKDTFKSLHHELVKDYKISKSKAEELYSSKYVRHFYTEAEIAEFLKKRRA